MGEKLRCRGFPHLALDLPGCVFLLGAMGGQRRQLGRAQTREIFGFGQLRVEHVGIVQANINAVIGAFSDCVRMPIRVGF